MIERLARALADAGLSPEPGDLADLLWLATQIGGRAQASGRSPGHPAPPSAPEGEARRPDAGQPSLQPDDGMPDTQDDHPVDPVPGIVSGTFADGVLHVRGVAATGMPASLTTSLQAFSRRLPSHVEEVLDEETTAERACETGFWMPVMQAEREYGFDLMLVTEESDTSCLWTDAINEFAHMLSTQVAFRHVHRLRLTGAGGKLVDDHGTADVLSRWRGARTAQVLLVSDTLSPAWTDGRMAALLRTWCEVGPVTLLQPMPRRAWRHLPLGLPDLKLTACGIVRHNRQLACQALDDWFDAPAPDALPLPVIGLDARSLQDWATVMTGRAGATLAGVGLATDCGGAHDASTDPATPPCAAERVALFRQMVSPAAYRLAVHLSVLDQMTIPVMRLVQRIMHPDSGAGEMAEVFLGGLLERVGAPGQQGVLDRLYRFDPEVRQVLVTSRRYSDERAIDFRLAGIDARMPHDNPKLPSEFGCFLTPSAGDRQTDWVLPFSATSRQMLVDHVARSPAVLAAARAGEFDRAAAAKQQREALREVALESLYALVDDEVIGDIPLILKPDDSLWLVGLVRHVLVMAYASDGRAHIVFAVAVEHLVLVDAETDGNGHGRLNFHAKKRSVEYDPALWAHAFQLQLQVKDLGLKCQKAKAERLQRTIHGYAMRADEFAPDTTFFKVATPEPRTYGALDAAHAPAFKDLEGGWFAPFKQALLHTYGPAVDVKALLGTFLARIGGRQTQFFAVPVRLRRKSMLVHISDEHARTIIGAARALQIESAQAVDIFFNSIRAVFKSAVGISWTNPELGGLLTYSFFDDEFELGGMDLGDPIYLDDAAQRGEFPDEDEIEKADPHELAAWLSEAVDSGRVPGLADGVARELEYVVNRADWLVDVESHMHTEADFEQGHLEAWAFDKKPFTAVEFVDDDMLLVTRIIRATVRVEATISFSLRDGSDMTWVGFRDVERSLTLHLEAEFGFGGVAKKEPVLLWMEIEHIAQHVSFGIVEPNFGNLDDDELVDDE